VIEVTPTPKGRFKLDGVIGAQIFTHSRHPKIQFRNNGLGVDMGPRTMATRCCSNEIRQILETSRNT